MHLARRCIRRNALESEHELWAREDAPQRHFYSRFEILALAALRVEVHQSRQLLALDRTAIGARRECFDDLACAAVLVARFARPANEDLVARRRVADARDVERPGDAHA